MKYITIILYLFFFSPINSFAQESFSGVAHKPGVKPIEPGTKWESWPLGYKPWSLTTWVADNSMWGKWLHIGTLWCIAKKILFIVAVPIDVILIIALGSHVLFVTYLGVYLGRLLALVVDAFLLLIIIGWLS